MRGRDATDRDRVISVYQNRGHRQLLDGVERGRGKERERVSTREKENARERERERERD